MVAYTPIPNEFKLYEAYPNPFNPITTVRYAFPVDVDMNLSVYDIQGRFVANLFSGFTAAGYYDVEWNASGHTSGLYLIHLKAFDLENKLQFNELQKIMLVK